MVDAAAKERPAALVRRLMPFAATLGIEVHVLEPREVRGSLAWSEERCTSDGMLHGGALMALADTTGALCGALNLPGSAVVGGAAQPGTGTTTVDSATTFLRGVRGGSVWAVSHPLRAGRRVISVATELRDDNGELVAVVHQTQLVLDVSGTVGRGS